MRLLRPLTGHVSCLRTLPRWKIVAALGAGVGLALSFPIHPVRPLAWVALAPLLATLEGEGARARFWLGWLCGAGLFVVGLHWLVGTMHHFGYLPLPLSILGQLLLAGFLACFPGAFALGAPALGLGRAWGVLGLPALWVTTEGLRSWLFTGFPWFTLGYSQMGYLSLVQVLDVTGIHGLSALLVAASVVTERVWAAARGRGAWPLVSGVGVASVVAAALAYGSWRLAETPAPAPTLEVALLQGNIPQDQKWDEAFKASTVDTYLELADRVAGHGPDLVVLPETALPFWFQNGGPNAERALGLATRTGARVIVGAPAFVEHDAEPGAERSYEYRNRAYLLDPEGRVADRYDKLHLVPFGEYSPVPFLSAFVEGVGNFRPGEQRVLFDIPGFGRIGTLICYEAIFPEEARAAVRGGARLLVNITNDAWFGELGAPVQHLEMAVARAVENRVWVVRAANTGI
ncbi:MAG: apolipoprotein N-acyltransferase, partial [Myxococcales bacterium]|nr:apolipoprotein N-acyltransferase [Myxococcales bacterium]